MSDIVLERFTDSKRVWMAAKYEIEYSKGIPIRIRPASDEIISKPTDNSSMLRDYLNLIKECVTEGRKTYEYTRFLPASERESTYVIRKQREEKKLLSKKLLEFCNQWGLFGIMLDEALLTFMKIGEQSIRIVGANPTYAIKRVDQGTSQDFGKPIYEQIPYNEYARPFFPLFSGKAYPYIQRSRKYLQHYSESIDSILFNHRFMSSVRYVMDLRDGSECSMDIDNLNFCITRKDNKISYSENPRTAIELFQLLMYINETSGNGREFGICARCGAPYLYNVANEDSDEALRHRKYCDERCRKNANRHPKKGAGKNEQASEQ